VAGRSIAVLKVLLAGRKYMIKGWCGAVLRRSFQLIAFLSLLSAGAGTAYARPFKISWQYHRGGSNQWSKNIIQEFGFYKKVNGTITRYPVVNTSLGFYPQDQTGTAVVDFGVEPSTFTGTYVADRWSDDGAEHFWYDTDFMTLPAISRGARLLLQPRRTPL
jgi:hypothetical protein